MSSGAESYILERHNERTDIGYGVRFCFVGLHGQPDTVKGGIIISHLHDDGEVCEGSVTFDIPENAHLSSRPK